MTVATGEQDARFKKLLNDSRPKLVQAVRVWSLLRAHPLVRNYDHPDHWRREEWEPFRKALNESRTRKDKREGRTGVIIRPMWDPMLPGREELRGYNRAAQLVDYLWYLGWRWGISTDRRQRGPGREGGAWLPRWWIASHTPEQTDELGLDGCTDVNGVPVYALPRHAELLPLQGGGQVPVMDMWADPLPGNRGKTLRTEVVRAVWSALGTLEGRNLRPGRQRTRDRIANHLPATTFPELQDARPRSPLAHTLNNLGRGFRRNL